jgi:hypothetical protein
LRLLGWSRPRRVILLRRRATRPTVDRGDPAQRRLSFTEIGPDQQVWEYAALVTSLADEILTLGQWYRDRASCENAFDELKNQWGWGGFTTQDLARCRLLAGIVALIYNWWSNLQDTERDGCPAYMVKAPCSGGNVLAHARPRAEQVPQFVVSAAISSCRWDVLEAEHRPTSALAATMILLDRSSMATVPR